MLAELAIANAAFEVIKTAVSNGKEIFELGDHLAKFSDAGREIEHKAKLAKKGSEQESDLEIFMAQEAMRNKRDQLKDLMIRTRHLMWDDFLRFEGDQQKSRLKAQREVERAKVKRTDLIMTVSAWIVGFFVLAGSMVGGLKILIGLKG
jgi:multidrug resistance efflux pump